jgi:exonuclease VII small subunit
MASDIGGWHHTHKRLHTSEKKVMEMFGEPRAEPTLGAQMDLGRAAAALGWVAFGALAVGVATRSLWRDRHGPPNGQEEPDTQEPDVLLDVSELEVDRIDLEVEDLRAHVSILVELANLLNLSVGVDARLDQVKLEIEGVEADVVLKVRLKHIRAILEKALDTIGEHPEILRILARSLSQVVRESLEETLSTLDSALEGLEVGDTVDEALRGRLQEVRDALQDVLERSERGVEGAAQTALGEGQGGDTTASS